jgi:hypothetical protein
VDLPQETYNLDIFEMAEGRVDYRGRVFQVSFCYKRLVDAIRSEAVFLVMCDPPMNEL